MFTFWNMISSLRTMRVCFLFALMLIPDSSYFFGLGMEQKPLQKVTVEFQI